LGREADLDRTRPIILDTHEQIAVLVHGNGDVYRFLGIAAVTGNYCVGKSLSYEESDVLDCAPEFSPL
jgi:hypothetical protein